MHNLLIASCIGIAMMVVERIVPGTRLPKVSGWLWRAIMLNLCQIATVIIAGYTWNDWLRGGSLFHMRSLPAWAGAGLTYFVSTFIFYWWHRVRHESKIWWKLAHQIHHSASRLEILTSFYKHPFEIVINSIISAILVYPIMGCSVVQGGIYTLLIAVGEMFYHWNIHTPRWLGIWFQRPESHRIHHQRERHAKNYSDLPMWDFIFGTFSNPTNGDKVVCGFSNENEKRILSMLAVNEIEIKRQSEPIDFRPACFGCGKRHRCENEMAKML